MAINAAVDYTSAAHAMTRTYAGVSDLRAQATLARAEVDSPAIAGLLDRRWLVDEQRADEIQDVGPAAESLLLDRPRDCGMNLARVRCRGVRAGCGAVSGRLLVAATFAARHAGLPDVSARSALGRSGELSRPRLGRSSRAITSRPAVRHRAVKPPPRAVPGSVSSAARCPTAAVSCRPNSTPTACRRG